mmetsp:Transcript_97598/g.164170  ORF Transcript_97598/g.164170 Transcript_97598/m.164170 type:complete len:291 (+) Transcript_97598:5182-6054(+)
MLRGPVALQHRRPLMGFALRRVHWLDPAIPLAADLLSPLWGEAERQTWSSPPSLLPPGAAPVPRASPPCPPACQWCPQYSAGPHPRSPDQGQEPRSSPKASALGLSSAGGPRSLTMPEWTPTCLRRTAACPAHWGHAAAEGQALQAPTCGPLGRGTAQMGRGPGGAGAEASQCTPAPSVRTRAEAPGWRAPAAIAASCWTTCHALRRAALRGAPAPGSGSPIDGPGAPTPWRPSAASVGAAGPGSPAVAGPAPARAAWPRAPAAAAPSEASVAAPAASYPATDCAPQPAC